MTFVLGLVLGVVLGVGIGLAFFWALGKEADRKFEKAKEYSENGEKRYREAVQSLNNSLKETERRKKMINDVRGLFIELYDVVKDHLPSRIAEEIKELIGDFPQGEPT